MLFLSMHFFTQDVGSLSHTIFIKAIPNSSRSEVSGNVVSYKGSLYLKVLVHAAPVDNSANHEIVELFSKLLNIRTSAVSIIVGAQSRYKKILILSSNRDTMKDVGVCLSHLVLKKG